MHSFLAMIAICGPCLLMIAIISSIGHIYNKHLSPRQTLKALRAHQPIEVTQARRDSLVSYANGLAARGRLTEQDLALIRRYTLFTRATR